MDQSTISWVVAAAVVVSALAIVLQAILMFALYRSAQATREQVTLLVIRSESVLDQARQTLEVTRIVPEHVEVVSVASRTVVHAGRGNAGNLTELPGQIISVLRAQLRLGF